MTQPMIAPKIENGSIFQKINLNGLHGIIFHLIGIIFGPDGV